MRQIEEITSEESYRLTQAEFKGMTIQALRDIRDDINEIKQQNNITRWISFGIAGIAGIVSNVIGKEIKL